jgi:hypothetical protein
MKIGVWLAMMVEPLLARVLLALGFSVVSIVGVEAALTGIKSSFVVSFNSMPAEWVQFALYLWIGKGLGVIFGAMATKLMLWSIQSATSLLGKSA